MRTIVVGLSPKDGLGPLDPAGASGSRLAGLTGLTADDYISTFDRVNLRQSADSGVDDGDAARDLRPILRGRRVLALGRSVASALGIDGPWFEWHPRDGFVGASMPHPSGLSRWWNYPSNRRTAGEFMEKSTRPCVHVEGPDGSGKSTLVPELARIMGLDVVPTDDPPKSWDECLGRIERRIEPGLVCDRSSGLVSELVYGPVLRGRTITDEEDIWSMVRSVVHAVVFVYCRPPSDRIRPTFRDGEDPEHVRGVLERSDALVNRYDDVMSRLSRMGVRIVGYDWTRQTVEEVARCVG
jgi:energy-coupling factor transporter ATP-binding protein EcfA2